VTSPRRGRQHGAESQMWAAVLDAYRHPPGGQSGPAAVDAVNRGLESLRPKALTALWQLSIDTWSMGQSTPTPSLSRAVCWLAAKPGRKVAWYGYLVAAQAHGRHGSPLIACLRDSARLQKRLLPCPGAPADSGDQAHQHRGGIAGFELHGRPNHVELGGLHREVSSLNATALLNVFCVDIWVPQFDS
jgi:hypothetical protein